MKAALSAGVWKRPHPQEISDYPDRQAVHREGVSQVHRHLLQVRPRTLPDPGRQGRLHGTPQEGQEGVDVHVEEDANNLDIDLLSAPRRKRPTKRLNTTTMRVLS